MTSTPTPVVSELQIIPTLKLASSLGLQHWLLFSFLALLSLAPSMLNYDYGQVVFSAFGQAQGAPLMYTVEFIISVLSNGVLSLVIVLFTFQKLQGVKTSLMRCFHNHPVKIPTVIWLGAFYLFTLGIYAPVYFVNSYLDLSLSTLEITYQMTGLVTFTIQLVFFFFIPVLIIDQTSLRNSLRKSLELSKGNLLSIFGIMLFFSVLSYILQTVFQFVQRAGLLPLTRTGLDFFIPQIIETLVFTYGIITLTVAYHLLLQTSSKQVASVFD